MRCINPNPPFCLIQKPVPAACPGAGELEDGADKAGAEDSCVFKVELRGVEGVREHHGVVKGKGGSEGDARNGKDGVVGDVQKAGNNGEGKCGRRGVGRGKSSADKWYREKV